MIDRFFRPKWLQNDWSNKNSTNKNADSTNMLNQHVESWLKQQKYADWTGRGNPLWVDPCKISPSCLGHFEENDFCQPCHGVILFTDKATWKNKHGDLRKHKILGLKFQSHKNWWYDSSKVGMLLGIHTAQDINITNGESHHHLNVCQTYSVSGV